MNFDGVTGHSADDSTTRSGDVCAARVHRISDPVPDLAQRLSDSVCKAVGLCDMPLALQTTQALVLAISLLCITAEGTVGRATFYGKVHTWFFNLMRVLSETAFVCAWEACT